MAAFDWGFHKLLYSYLKKIPVNSSICSSDLYHFVRSNGYSNKATSAIGNAMKKLGFEASGRGAGTYWYRISFPELDKRITEGYPEWSVSKPEAPTLQERLASQIESGEREAPAGYSEWCAEQEKKEKGEMEQHKALGWTASTDLDVITTEKPYEFETVETTIKLVGKYGTYKVCSDGTTVDLLVSGTLSDEELRMLSRELDAVYCRVWRK